MQQFERAEFEIEQYIEEHEIDKVLILGDVSYFLHGSVLE